MGQFRGPQRPSFWRIRRWPARSETDSLGKVLVADHAAEAGAGCGELVLKLGEPLSELCVLRGRLSFRRGQPQVLLGELVDALDQVVVAELFDLLSEMNAGLLSQLDVFGPEPLDLLSGEKQVVEFTPAP
ncbi:hypothetical protein [Streptomyces globisporus]|uniref:hypothetical protein n=1 Tax=Streptomyces globisporus TaxID=1908 RepID=UPI0034615E5D